MPWCLDTEVQMARYEITDDQWAVLKDLFPKQARGGKWLDHRTVLNGMLGILRSGAPWRDLPERYGIIGERPDSCAHLKTEPS